MKTLRRVILEATRKTTPQDPIKDLKKITTGVKPINTTKAVYQGLPATMKDPETGEIAGNAARAYPDPDPAPKPKRRRKENSNTAYPLTAGRVHIHEVLDVDVEDKYETLRQKAAKRGKHSLIDKLHDREENELKRATVTPGKARRAAGHYFPFKGNDYHAVAARRAEHDAAVAELYSRRMRRVTNPNLPPRKKRRRTNP